MKTIGLLGGMSWQSTVSYYQAINNEMTANLSGLHSAKICMYSVDFDQIEKLQKIGNWQETAVILSKAAQSIEAGGADFMLICTNTMHIVADKIQENISIPILHIADATAKKLQADGITTVGLLGTRFTMQEDFYKSRLEDKFGMQVIIPDEKDQTIVHDVIYNELCLGEVNDESKALYLAIVDKLYSQGAQAIILGCTEIALLIQQKHTQVPLYDTTEIHALSAVKEALK
ncbi:MAG: aspartate/glutamate racemase family protein [Marinicellaceae bacterium]